MHIFSRQEVKFSRMDMVSKIKGFTLVELLVGLSLSLFIAGLSFTYIVSSSRVFKIQTNDGYSQENARFALELMAQNIRLAGANHAGTFGAQFDTIFNDPICSNNETGVAGTTVCTTDELGNNSDRFGVDFIVGNDFLACDGSTVTLPAGTDNQRLANVFWTADLENNGAGNPPGDGVRSLYCQTHNVLAGAPVGVPLPLIDGIDAMQVQFGVDATGDGVINSYQSYGNIPAGSRAGIKAVRLALLINSGAANTGDVNTELVGTRTYQMLDGPTITRTNDSVARQIYSSTIMIPNTL